MARFRDGSRYLDFTVAGYEFPDAVSEEGKNGLDPNWLNCRFVYGDGGAEEAYTDPCLLTFELKGLAEALAGILNGEADRYASAYLEPYLRIGISREGRGISWELDFVYDTREEWKSRQLRTLLDMREAQALLSELRAMSRAFPAR